MHSHGQDSHDWVHAGEEPSPPEIRAELDRILNSPHLETSDKRREFLRFVVEETLNGRGGTLKGFTIAVSVFGRDESFDARSDPVVRLEARRLRRDLDGYYVDAGSADRVRISIPKGSYVPHFEWSPGALPPEASGDHEQPEEESGAPGLASPTLGTVFKSRWGMFLGSSLALLLLAAATAVWWLGNRSPPLATGVGRDYPSVSVLPFEALGSTENSRYLAAGINQELIGELARFRHFRLYVTPPESTGDTSMSPVERGRAIGVNYVIAGSVRDDATDILLAIQLIHAETGEVLWAGNYQRPLTPPDLIDLERELVAQITTELAQPYGVLNSDLQERLAAPAVSSMQSYLCVLRAYDYRRRFARAEFNPVRDCLERAVQTDPEYAEAWAMLGWLHLDAGRFEFAHPDARQSEYDRALETATKALSLEPDNPLALKALASIDHYLGRYDESERLARRAVALNPNDPDALVQLGWRLAVRGKFAEGIPLVERAIERTVNPPGWYFHLVAIDRYLKQDYEGMLEVAQRSAVDGSGFSQFLIAVADGALNDPEGARAALAKLSEFESLSRDPEGFIRRNGATDEITAALMSGLGQARQLSAELRTGNPPPAL